MADETHEEVEAEETEEVETAEEADATEDAHAAEEAPEADAAEENSDDEDEGAAKAKSRSRKPRGKSKSKKDDDDASDKKEKKEKKKKRFNRKQRISAGEKWLGELFERMHLEGVSVTGEIGDESLDFNIHGPDADQLLGAGRSSARTLESIETIMREAVLSSYDTNYTIRLDVNDFRKKRTEHLEGVARGLAEAAARIEKPITVAGFNSFERRVVHQTLSDDRSVETDSEGRGSFRKLRVEPR